MSYAQVTDTLGIFNEFASHSTVVVMLLVVYCSSPPTNTNARDTARAHSVVIPRLRNLDGAVTKHLAGDTEYSEHNYHVLTQF